ncbi:unnamed protein product [Pylaiella littoralis]
MNPQRSVSRVVLPILLAALCGVQAFVPPAAPFPRVAVAAPRAGKTSPLARSGSPGAFVGGVGPVASLSRSAAPRRRSALAMAAPGNNMPDKAVIANVGALSFAAVCSAVASAVAEISPHAAAFVQLTCLSIWLGMSVYATFVWPIITGLNMRDSSEFAALLGKLGPSYLQLSAAMIMSLGTSSLVIGHANEVQLAILGVALSITLYNALVLEPSALGALKEELEAEKRVQGNKKKVQGDNLPKIQANVANFLGAEALLDFLCILCALCYAWDLASSITFA